MSTQVSKTTADQLSAGTSLESALDVQGGEVGRKIEETHGAPKGLSLAVMIAWLLSLLRKAAERLRESDLAHQVELSDDVGPRRERDAAIASLRALMVRASDLIRGAFGEPYSEKVGLEAALKDRADLLSQQADGVVKLLRKTKGPKRGMADSTVSPDRVATELELASNRLRSAIETVKREAREAQQTLDARDAAMAGYERVYEGIVSIFIGLCLLAGLDDLASKVRASERRRREQAVETDEDTEAGRGDAAAGSGSASSQGTGEATS